MVTIGYGGLHLAKSFVCTARNYVLRSFGQNFGVNILMEMKQYCEILQGVSNSVFVGRDQQSDLLNFKLVGEEVQHSFKSNSSYLVSRVPERFQKGKCQKSQLSLHQLSVCQTSVSMSLLEELQLDGELQASSLNGKVASVVIALTESKCTNQYSVLQRGSLDFALEYCTAVHEFYQAISYFPPGGTRKPINIDKLFYRQNTVVIYFETCIRKERICLIPDNHSFVGCDGGIPWTKTIECLERTTQSWKVLKSCMEILKSDSSEEITSHCTANELYIEHPFGFTKKKGQGHNQSQVE